MKKALSLLLVASALAGASCKDIKGPPVAVGKKTIADSADQVLFHQRMIITDRGLNRAEIHSDTAYFFDENTRTDMRIVHAIFFNTQGVKDAVMTSRTGVYNQRLNALEARGDVVITGTDSRRLETPFVRYDQRVNLISSDTTFTMTDPDGRVVKGIGFTSDPDLTSVRVLRQKSAKAGPVAVPK